MIRLENICKTYTVGNQQVKGLDNVSFTVEKGKFVVILGPSGSGKSTLLNVLGGMDRASSGSFRCNGKEITTFSDYDLSIYRRDVVGFVFQFYNLIPSLTVAENVGIAAQLTGNNSKTGNYLERVGLGHRKNNFPSQLSGGEMQRVSIARALAKSPKLLLCDEPTGALDSTTGLKIVELLKGTAENSDTAVIMVTHNAEFAKVAHKVVRLHDGKIARIEETDYPSDLEEIKI